MEPPAAVDRGVPGGSARREYERRVAKREARVREAHPRLGGLILALTDDPQSTTAWDSGARGEELLGTRLEVLAERGVLLLHDRRIPRSRANIDHIAVCAGGVWVIDAKRYRGKRPGLRVEGGILRPRVEKLMVGSRDSTSLVEGMRRQVAVVRDELETAGLGDLPVHGALCFLDADWPLFGGAFSIGDIAVLWPKKLAAMLTVDGPVSHRDVEAAHKALATALRPA